MNFISPEEKTFQLNFEREADFIINDIIDELAYNTEMILAEKEITISDEKTLKIFKSFMDAAQLAISEFLVTMKNFYKKLSQEFYDFWVIQNFRMAPTPEEYAAAAFDHDEIALIYSGLVNQFLAKLREYEEHDDTLKFLSETIQIATLMFLEIFNIVCLETNTYSIEGYIADNYSEIYENWIMKVTKTLYVGDDDKMTIENKGLLYYLLFTRVGEEINNQVLTGEEFDPVFLMNVLQLSRDFLQEEIKKYQEKNPRQDQQTQDSLNMISLVINKTFSPNETNVDSMYNFVSKLLLSVDARQI